MEVKFVANKCLLGFMGALLILCLYTPDRTVRGMPMFARRYGVGCNACHTSPPRLNETGYKFRAAGFRMPDEIGAAPAEKKKIANHVGFRLQPRIEVLRSTIGQARKHKVKPEFFAAEGYLWYGPVSRYFSSSTKFTVWPDESNETEFRERLEGTVHFDKGTADNFVDLRAGVSHPLEGFGGSESYWLSNTKPFIQELKTANFNQDTLFTSAGTHQASVTGAFYHKRTTIRGYLSSGIRVALDDEGKLEAFGRKEPFTKALGQSGKGGPDVQIFFNQILHPDGGNISVDYYNGRSYLPRLDLLPRTASPATSSAPGLSTVNAASELIRNSAVASGPNGSLDAVESDPFDDPPTLTKAELANLPYFKNNFQRLAFSAGYPIRKLNLLYGVQYGRDAIGTGGHFSSLGQYVEGTYKVVNDISAVGARYDWFDPARIKANNEINGVTVFGNIWLHSELRIAAEFQHAQAKRGHLQPDRKDNTFQLRLYWIR